jgi:hypothetical protein
LKLKNAADCIENEGDADDVDECKDSLPIVYRIEPLEDDDAVDEPTKFFVVDEFKSEFSRQLGFISRKECITIFRCPLNVRNNVARKRCLTRIVFMTSVVITLRTCICHIMEVNSLVKFTTSLP